MELKITTLIENQPDNQGQLSCEHGLSLFIEFDGKRILFDTGQTGAFADNAEKLGIDLSDLDAVVLSHGHYDHSGGVPRLLPLLSRGTPIYTGDGFFSLKYKRLDFAFSGGGASAPESAALPGSPLFRYNGNPFPAELISAYPVRLTRITDSSFRLAPRIFLFRDFLRNCPFELPNPRFYLGDSSGFWQDLFEDEIALGLLTGKGLVLVSGCAHPGIINMLRTVSKRTEVPLYAVLGGTHLVEAGEERLTKTLEAFRELGLVKIAVSHCTGREGENRIRDVFAEQFIRNNTGCVFQL